MHIGRRAAARADERERAVPGSGFFSAATVEPAAC